MPVDPIWQWYAKYEPYHTGDYYKCDHHIPVHRNHPVTDGEPFNNIEQPQKVNE